MEAMTSSSCGTLSKILILRNRIPWWQTTEPILAHLTPPILHPHHPPKKKTSAHRSQGKGGKPDFFSLFSIYLFSYFRS